MNIARPVFGAALLLVSLGPQLCAQSAQSAPPTLKCASASDADSANSGDRATLFLPLRMRTVQCPVSFGLHFKRYVESQLDWGAPLTPLLTTVPSQAFTTHGGYPSGIHGLGDQYRVEVEQEAAGKFLRHFVFATVFRQDEDYQPLYDGSTGARIGHAVRHLFITQSADHSHSVFNMEGIPASFASAEVGNQFEPPSERGWTTVRGNFIWSLVWRITGDLINEYSPEWHRLLP